MLDRMAALFGGGDYGPAMIGANLVFTLILALSGASNDQERLPEPVSAGAAAAGEVVPFAPLRPAALPPGSIVTPLANRTSRLGGGDASVPAARFSATTSRCQR